MSHKKLRKEKNCLNCGDVVEERFCTHCGQENIEIRESAFHMIIHYIQDLFHYDGRFWHTLKTLVVKPGQVAVEYMEGKRTRNLEPIRFYVFASTVFFLLLFTMYKADAVKDSSGPEAKLRKRLFNLEQEKKIRKGTEDTAYVNFLTQPLKASIDSINYAEGDTSKSDVEMDISNTNKPDSTHADTAVKGWFLQFLEKREKEKRKEFAQKLEEDSASATADLLNEIFHKLPQLLFLSMPFFAFFLKLLYINSSRRNYVDHFIFSVYHYSYLFTIMIFYLVLQYMVDKSANEALQFNFDFVTGGLVIYAFIYLLLSMKRFYLDRWTYLIPRYLILMFLSFITILVLFLMIILLIYLL